MNTPDEHAWPGGDLPEDEALAAEYVLGVLDHATRERVAARIAREPAFAATVDAWDAHFDAWTQRVSPVAPGVHVWPRVRTALGWSPVDTGKPTSRWQDIRTWQAATALAASIAAVAVLFALRERPAPPPLIVARPVQVPAPAPVPRPVTVLARDDGSTAWVASIDASTGSVHMVPVPAPADAAGRANELWIIPAGQAPISLGRLSSDATQTVELPAAARAALRIGATLAVTLEPPVGIPHAAPTGPIIGRGVIEHL